MKKLSRLLTLIGCLYTLPTLGSYSDDMNIGFQINACATKNENQAEFLERELKKKFPKNEDSELIFHGVKIEKPRTGLVALLIDLLPKNEGAIKIPTSKIFSNGNYKNCKDSICLADSIFGKGLGAYYLYILDEYNLNLSHLSDEKDYEGGLRHARSMTFTKEELISVLIPLRMLPKESLKLIKYNYPLKRINKYKGNTIANATMHLFNLWGTSSYSEKMVTIVHELGHVFGDSLGEKSPDTSDEWASLSGWQWDREKLFDIYDNSIHSNSANFVSSYAKNNPVEDFAESFTAYILNPEYIKAEAPMKYQYLKKNIFANLEYDMITCSKTKEIDLAEYLQDLDKMEIKSIARQCEYSFTKTLMSLDMSEFQKCVIGHVLGMDSYPLSLPISVAQETLKQSKNYNQIREEIVDQFAEEIPEISQGVLDHVLLMDSMKPGYGDFDYSSDVANLNKLLNRWVQRRLELEEKPITTQNVKAAMKKILLERSK